MNVNIKHLSLGKTEHCVIIKMQATDNEDNYPYNHYVLKSEVPAIIAALQGENEFTSRDVANYATFNRFGVYVITTSHISSGIGRNCKYDGYFKASQYTFPGIEFARILRTYYNADNEESFDASVYIPDWSSQYAPIVNVQFGEGVENKLAQDIASDRLTESPRDLVPYLVDWASQYSSGNPVSVTIVFDGYQDTDRPSNYYWYIMDDNTNKRLINGGFIAHEDNNRLGMFSYSVHT
jgi:hypothetical protein